MESYNFIFYLKDFITYQWIQITQTHYTESRFNQDLQKKMQYDILNILIVLIMKRKTKGLTERKYLQLSQKIPNI